MREQVSIRVTALMCEQLRYRASLSKSISQFQVRDVSTDGGIQLHQALIDQLHDSRGNDWL